MPMPSRATKIWPTTKRSPPSMKRVIRSAIAPSATSPATPTAMPSTVKRYPRGNSARRAITLGRSPFEARLHGPSVAAAPPPREPDRREEDLQREAHAGRDAHERASRQHAGDRVEDAEGRPR